MNVSSKIIGTIEIVCPRCGHNISNQKIIGDHTELGECRRCGKLTYSKELRKISLQEIQNNYSIKCPYCNSTDVKKISTTSKVAHVAVFGVLGASKVMHQWHCKNCKSDF